MHLIFCVDDRDGMSFCGRRLSQDKLLTAHILRMCAGNKLWMNRYSSGLFPQDAVITDEDFLHKAGQEDYCFLENLLPPDDISGLKSVILYCWNRSYPSTLKFPRELLSDMRLVHTEDFPGNSHENITMQRYML